MKKKFYYLGPDLQYFTARQCYACLVSAVKEDIHEKINFLLSVACNCSTVYWVSEMTILHSKNII